MFGYVAARLLVAFPMMLAVSIVTFFIMHVSAGAIVPGLELNPYLQPEDVQRIRASLGLDRPLSEQYSRWITGLMRGDLGISMVDSTPVADLLWARLPNTLWLTGTALLLGVGAALPIGVLAALRRGTAVDDALTAVAVAGHAIPQFWLGLILILVFSVTFRQLGLPWLPSSGATEPFGGGDVVDRLRHLVLPATVLAFAYLAVWSRFVRSGFLEVLGQDYIRTARSKGLAERRVLYVHALRNAALPLITLVGLELPAFFSGSAVIEVVFGWPGVGRLIFERAVQYDYTTVLGITTFGGFGVIAANLVADLLYALLDPRVRR